MVDAQHAKIISEHCMLVSSQFGGIRMAGPDIFILDVVPASVHVEPISRLGAQESCETVEGEVLGLRFGAKGEGCSTGSSGAHPCNMQ